MPALLCCYFLVSLAYAFVCGRLGHAYAALAGYQSYVRLQCRAPPSARWGPPSGRVAVA